MASKNEKPEENGVDASIEDRSNPEKNEKSISINNKSDGKKVGKGSENLNGNIDTETLSMSSPRTETDENVSDEEVFYTVDEAVDKAGYGKFQTLVTFLAGMGWFADAFEILILSVIGELITCEWHILQYQNALITSVVFSCMAFGAPVFGSLADKFGRKIALGISMLFLFVFGAASAFSTTIIILLVLRGFMGFALGGVAQGVTLCCEYYPTQSRGIAGFYLSYFWGVGTILMIAIAWIVMRTLGSWRIFLFIAAFPALIVFAVIKWYPESARYYLVSGQYDKAVKQLKKMAAMNKAELPVGHLRKITKDDLEARGRIKDLLKKRYRKSTLLLWYIWFGVAFTYYGVALTQPVAIKYGKLTGIVDEHAKNETRKGLNSVLECKHFSDWDFFNLLWTSAAEFPGLLVFTILVHYLQRKTLLSVASLIESVNILLLLINVDTKILINVILFFARGNICGIFQLLYIMTSEAFPTTLRAIGMGTCSALARIGGAIVPFATQAVVIEHPQATLCTLAVVIFLAAIAAAFLPEETKGLYMTELSRDRRDTVKDITEKIKEKLHISQNENNKSIKEETV